MVARLPPTSMATQISNTNHVHKKQAILPSIKTTKGIAFIS
jgi:hypothetical protein